MIVIAYSDPRNLNKHPLWDEFKKYPQFCATKFLAEGMDERYGESDGLWSVSIGRIFRLVFPDWHYSTTRVEQFACLTKLIDRLRERRPSSKRILDSFRRNQNTVLDAIRTLVEGGIRPGELTPQKNEQEVFQELFELFVTEDSHVHRFENTFESLASPSEGISVLKQALDGAAGKAEKEGKPAKPLISKFDTVVFHGFYFITPFQNRFMKALQKAGLDICHLICWDESIPSVMSVWESFFENKDEWMRHAESSAEPLGRFFASLYEHGRAEPPGVDISVIEFPTVGSFVRYISQTAGPDNRFKECFFSPTSRELNRVLREYFPEEFADRHFLAYPVGQFLYHLHQMWDDSTQSLAIDETGLKACLASGMLRLNDESPFFDSQSATVVLRKCLPFFDGCRTVAEWRNRLRDLQQAISAAQELDPENADRFSLAVENPFRFPAFVVSQEEFQILQSAIEQLFKIAEELFSRPTVSLKEHLSRLKEIIETADGSGALIDEERELVKKVLSDLTPETASDTAFPTQDLSEAIRVYLAIDNGPEDDDEDSKSKQLVNFFESLDGLPLKEERPLHLCMLSADSLPARKSFCPWPLTLECLPEQSDVRRLIQAREESSHMADLYLFYSALAFAPQVILSWIKEWQDELKDVSPYLLMIVDSAGAKVERFSTSFGLDMDISPEAESVIKDPGLVSLEYPSHAAAEHDFCPRRFFYSYIVSDRPRFENSFHHRFQFSRLIDWYRARFGVSQDQARQFAYKFFPHWSMTRKTSIADMWTKANPTLEGQPIPDVVRRILFPGESHHISFRKDRIVDLADGDSSDRARLQLEANPGKHCRYCPHQRLCGDTLFPVDS